VNPCISGPASGKASEASETRVQRRVEEHLTRSEVFRKVESKGSSKELPLAMQGQVRLHAKKKHREGPRPHPRREGKGGGNSISEGKEIWLIFAIQGRMWGQDVCLLAEDKEGSGK